MNPTNSPLLWKSMEQGLRMLSTEEKLRAEVTPVLDELAEVFAGVQEVSQSADPLILMKVWSLSNIGDEEISVSGFMPREFVRMNQTVMVRVAPSHDMTEYGDAPIATRVIKLEADPFDDSTTTEHGIEIYGLNIYVPNADEGLGDFGVSSGKLLLIDQKGGTSVSKKPVNGVTPVIAVRNRNSGVAKVYAVDIFNDAPAGYEFEPMQRVCRRENALLFAVPDGRYVRIELLTGEKLAEVLGEFKKAVEAIKQSDVLNSLSEEERTAALSHLSGRHRI